MTPDLQASRHGIQVHAATSQGAVRTERVLAQLRWSELRAEPGPQQGGGVRVDCCAQPGEETLAVAVYKVLHPGCCLTRQGALAGSETCMWSLCGRHWCVPPALSLGALSRCLSASFQLCLWLHCKRSIQHVPDLPQRFSGLQATDCQLRHAGGPD